MSEILADSVAVDTSVPETEEVVTDQPEVEEEVPESVADGDDTDDEDDGEVIEGSEDDEQAEQVSSPDAVDVEFEGETYSLPPKLKDALMREQDYTVKTQAHADTVKAHEAEKQDFKQYVEMTTANSTNMAQLTAIDNQLSQLAAYDWNAAYDNDITAATKLKNNEQQLIAQRQGLEKHINEQEQERQGLQHQNMVKTAQATDAQMLKEVPNWGDDRKTALGSFAVEKMGFTPDAVQKAVTKKEIMTLHYAEIGYNAVHKVKAAQAKAGKKVPQLEASKSIKPKRQSAPKTLSNVTDPVAYREMRLKQQRSNRK